jgi:undecaprenyl diphosphate synthase
VSGQRLLDVGTGAGLPGVPLAILFPQRAFHLLDSNGKKTRFLFQVKTALGLDNMMVHQARVETYRVTSPYDAVLSRAFASLQDMVQACRHAMLDGIRPEALDEAVLSRYMALSFAPDPDLFIRTGGEMRISNFLLWQSAYSEFVFTERLWPDFDETDIDAAIQAYRQRDRRYGGIPTEELVPQGI